MKEEILCSGSLWPGRKGRGKRLESVSEFIVPTKSIDSACRKFLLLKSQVLSFPISSSCTVFLNCSSSRPSSPIISNTLLLTPSSPAQHLCSSCSSMFFSGHSRVRITGLNMAIRNFIFHKYH